MRYLQVNNAWTVRDLRAVSKDGTDTLTNIEKLQFISSVDGVVGIDEKLIEGDEESYDYKKLEFETNHLKILYPAIYVKENNNLFFN